MNDNLKIIYKKTNWLERRINKIRNCTIQEIDNLLMRNGYPMGMEELDHLNNIIDTKFKEVQKDTTRDVLTDMHRRRLSEAGINRKYKDKV